MDCAPHASPAKALFVGFLSKLSIPRLGLVQLVRIPHCHGRAASISTPSRNFSVFCDGHRRVEPTSRSASDPSVIRKFPWRD